jgi:hypothetical protein
VSGLEGFALPSDVRVDGTVTIGTGEGVAIVAPRVTPAWIESIVRSLAAATAPLRARPAGAIVDVLGRTGERFLDDGDDLRREALDLLPASAGVSIEMARVILDGMAVDWTVSRLRHWLEAELTDPRCLDGLIDVGGRRVMAVGPALCTQVVSGSVPGVGVNALLRSLAVKAPTLLKPGFGDVVLPVLFARGLREADAELANAVAVVYWPGGSVDVERAALSGAETVVVYGSDDTVTALRALVPATARLVAYRHRIGVAVVGRGALTGARAPTAAGEVARAVAIFEQRGCVCPHVVFAEQGGEVEPHAFARLVAEALEALAEELPAAALPIEEASAVQQLRANAELMATAAVESWHGGSEASWTVVYDPGARAGAATVGRAVRVAPIEDASSLAHGLGPIGAHLQTVGVTGLGQRVTAITEALGRTGASRVVPLHAVSFPPPWWMHDGRGGLQDLVRWVELEEG